MSGLVKGKAKGYFKLILSKLKSCGYEVKASLLNAAFLGVPQARQRIIFVGVRKDLVERFGVHPCFPKPFPYSYTVADALKGVIQDEEELKIKREDVKKGRWGREILPKLPKNPPKSLDGSYVTGGSYFNLKRESMFKPCSTICATAGGPSFAGNCHPLEDRKFTIPELKRLTSLPDDFVTTGTLAQQWERMGRMVPPLMMKAVAETVRDQILRRVK